MGLADFAQALGASQELVPDYVQQQLTRRLGALQTQNFALQNRRAEQQIAAADADAADETAFTAWTKRVGAKPSLEQIREGQYLFPKFAPQLAEAAKGMEAAQRTKVVSDMSQTVTALGANRLDLARAIYQRHIDADRRAGRPPDAADEAILAMIDSGDPEQIKAARGFVFASLAAIDDKAAKALAPDTENHFSSTGDGAIYDQRDGTVTRQAPPKTQYRIIKNGDGSDSIVELTEGGGPASGVGGGAAGGNASTAAGRTFGGWTPRARNGGDNTDAAVDSKNAGMAKALGVGIDTPFPAGTTPEQIYEALTLSEGGAGSLADRNNNRGNLRDPKTLQYRQFGDKRAGDAAGIAQVRRNLARGQNTIRKMVEGLPVGGKSSAAPAASGPRVVFTSKPGEASPVDQATVDFYADKVARGGDLPTLGSGKESSQWRRAILQKAAQLQTDRGISGGESNLAQADVKANRSALLQAQKTYSAVVGFEDTFQRNIGEVVRLAPKGVAGGVPLFNRWVQAGRREVKGDPQISAFTVAVNTVANEYAKIASGNTGGGVLSDSARHEAMELLNTAQTLPQLMAAIKQLRIDGHNRVLALDTQIKRLRGNIAGAGAGNASSTPAAPKPGAVVRGYRFKGGNPADRASWVKVGS